jgi:hypothetical protein
MKRSTNVILLLGLLALYSCKRSSCKSDDPILGTYGPEKEEYKKELIRQLEHADRSALSCWISSHWQKKNREGVLLEEHIRLHIQGDNLCAEMIMRVNENNKGITGNYELMLDQEKMDFEDVSYRVVRDKGKTEFVLEEIAGITD